MAVPPPATASVWVPVLFQYQMPVSLVMLAPLASVMPLVTSRPPFTVRFRLLLLPSVTLFSVGVAEAVRALPAELMMVPPVIVPLRLFRPPVPNTPALSMSSVRPVLFRMPVMLTRPPVRVKLPSTGVPRLPPRFSVPAERLKAPVLLALVPERFMMPPLTSSVPALLQAVEFSVVVPAAVASTPPAALLKLVTWMVEVVEAVLWRRVPRFTTLAALLS